MLTLGSVEIYKNKKFLDNSSDKILLNVLFTLLATLISWKAYRIVKKTKQNGFCIVSVITAPKIKSALVSFPFFMSTV